MNTLTEILRHSSLASLGLFAGAMLTEGLVLVPSWRAMPPADFFAWYATNEPLLLRLFTPLTACTALLALAAAVASLATGHAGRWFACAAAGIMLVTVGMFYAFFQQANAQFSSATAAPNELATLLSRWAAWHHWRTALSLVAMAVATLGFRIR